MAKSVVIIICLLSLIIYTCSTRTEFSLEAEDFVDSSWTTNQPAASGKKTAMLKDGMKIHFPFCLRTDSSVSFKEVIFSLDDDLDEKVDFKLDGHLVNRSDIFISSIDNSSQTLIHSRDIFLTYGRHIWTVVYKSPDPDGMELDRITVSVSDDLLTKAMLDCEVYCLPKIPFHFTRRSESLPPAVIVSNTRSTNCTEEQNVLVDFYHPSVKAFRISAQHPAYRSVLNTREANFENCQVIPPIVWEFENVTLLSDAESELILTSEDGSVTTITKDEQTSCHLLVTKFNITIDRADIETSALGGSLIVNISGHETDVAISVNFTTKDGEFKTHSRVIPVSENHVEIEVPDRSWSRLNDVVELSLCSGGRNVGIDSWTLIRRELKTDSAQKVTDNGEFVAEAVFHDMWWMGDKGMTINVTNSDKIFSGHYLRVYTPVPFGGYSQTLVIYQNGVIRLLPSTIHGADWIPFGSSVLVGRFDPKEAKVSAEIQNIEINPGELKLTVTFVDGSVWLYELRYGLERTFIDVQMLSEGQSPELTALPFLQFRSMFVKDGRSNVDRLSVNGMKEHRILDKWSRLFGHSFFFYRGCASDYHTQAPDINIELLK